MNIVETPRLFLRKLRDDDLSFLVGLFGNPEVMKYSLNGPFSPEKVKIILEKMLWQDKEYGFSACMVVGKETGEPMGICGLWWCDGGSLIMVDFAYRFMPQYWGRGYATEAVQACLDYITTKYPQITLEAYIEKENKASVRVAEKCHMHFVEKTMYHDLPVLKYFYSAITYRKAEKADCQRIAELCDIASDGMVDFLFEEVMPGITPIQILKTSFQDEESNRSYKNVIVAECNGRVVAMLFAYSSYYHCIDDDMREHFPAERLEVMEPFFNSRVDDTLYIDTICVDKDFRNRGIGKQLIELAKQMSDKLSLIAFADNDAAIRFYHREGFEIVRRIPMEMPPQISHGDDMVLMQYIH